MVRMLEARGIPIICLKDGSRVGYLGEPIYTQDEEIFGFVVDGARGLSRKYLDLNDILRIGKDNCVIYSEASVRKLGKVREMLRNNRGLNALIGRDVRKSDGTLLGVVRDLAFDMETGMIEGFELSRGFMEDVRNGRNLILMRDGVELGDHCVMIKEETENEENGNN